MIQFDAYFFEMGASTTNQRIYWNENFAVICVSLPESKLRNSREAEEICG